MLIASILQENKMVVKPVGLIDVNTIKSYLLMELVSNVPCIHDLYQMEEDVVLNLVAKIRL